MYKTSQCFHLVPPIKRCTVPVMAVHHMEGTDKQKSSYPVRGVEPHSPFTQLRAHSKTPFYTNFPNLYAVRRVEGMDGEETESVQE